VDGFWPRLIRFVGGSITSELMNRLLVVAGLIVTGGAAAASTDVREIAVGATAALLISLVAGAVRVTRENRDENFIVLRRRDVMRVRDSGRRVEYSVEMDIRAKAQNLRECDLRFSWSGESKLAQCMQPGDSGYEVCTHETPEFTDFTCRFDRPLRRRQRRTIRLKFHLDEPNRTYLPQLTLDPRAYAWSAFARLAFVVFWDHTDPVTVSSISAHLYRSGWDRYRNAAKQSWAERHLTRIRIDGQSGRQWAPWPVRLDRWYILEFKLRQVDLDIPAQAKGSPGRAVERAE